MKQEQSSFCWFLPASKTEEAFLPNSQNTHVQPKPKMQIITEDFCYLLSCNIFLKSFAYQITGFNVEDKLWDAEYMSGVFSLQQPFAVTTNKRGILFIVIIATEGPKNEKFSIPTVTKL